MYGAQRRNHIHNAAVEEILARVIGLWRRVYQTCCVESQKTVKFYCLRCCRGFMKKSGLDNHEIDCSKFMPQRVLMPQDVKQREPLPGRKSKGEGKN